jgi:hypothetical protein
VSEEFAEQQTKNGALAVVDGSRYRSHWAKPIHYAAVTGKN